VLEVVPATTLAPEVTEGLSSEDAVEALPIDIVEFMPLPPPFPFPVPVSMDMEMVATALVVIVSALTFAVRPVTGYNAEVGTTLPVVQEEATDIGHALGASLARTTAVRDVKMRVVKCILID
jgi:hypothetical protein